MTLPDSPTADARLAAQLREALAGARYDAQAFAHATAGGGLDEADRSLATLLRLFALGSEVDADDAERALAPLGVDGATRLGVVRYDAKVAPALRIVPHDILVLASDLPADAPPPDHVAAAHAPSHALAQLTVREHVTCALDVGTGNGIQALLLAAHADRVVATDVTERALRFTELNAALNGITTIETRRGSFLEPVEGERFGCIVCSPPYVVSPDSSVLYRNAGVRGDVLSAELVAGVPALLDHGGFATILVSWIPRADEPEPLGWVPEGVGALVLRLETEDVDQIIRYWDGDPERWARWYREQEIERVAYGAVVLRAGGGLRDWLDTPGTAGPAGRHLERIFAAKAAPLPRVLTWSDDVVIERDGPLVTLSVRPGLGFSVELPADVVGAIEAHDPSAGAAIADLYAMGLLVPAPGSS